MPISALPPQALVQLAAVTDGAIRTGPLLGIPGLLRELGQDPAAVFREAGVDPSLFDDPERLIGVPTAGRLLARCAAATGCPHFALLLGHQTGLEALGLVGTLVEHSPDIGKALQNLVLHLHLHDRGAVPVLTIEGDQVLLGYTVYQPGIEGTRHIYDLAMAIALNIMKGLCGRDWRPAEVLFSHSQPTDLKPFRHCFRCPLRFDSERTALVFPKGCLSRPLPGADAELVRLLEARIAQLESLGAGDLVEQMRRVLRNLLLGGRGSIDQVAEIFGIHRRTLNRRMRARGLTFQELVEEVSYDIARQLLRETDLAIVAIAAVLDYADAAAFTRAFRRWSGTTPGAWRKDLGQG
jgi:AraC-like DNA-binding protein